MDRPVAIGRRASRWLVPAVALPPPELADAVSIPRYLNLGLTNLNPEQWFLGEIGDGPVLMETQKITTEPASRGR